MTDLVRELATLARRHVAWVRLHYVSPYPHVDDPIELMTGDIATTSLNDIGPVPQAKARDGAAIARRLKLAREIALSDRCIAGLGFHNQEDRRLGTPGRSAL